MKKEALKEYIMKYNGYAASINPHIKPTKGVSSGAHGRLYELLIKLSLMNYRFTGVSKAGRTDTRKKIDGVLSSIEIKSGAGELVCYDLVTEKVYSDVRNSAYIVYCPEYTPVVTKDYDMAVLNAVRQSFVMGGKEFYNRLKENNLVRTKKSAQWYSELNFSELEYDRETISNISQSEKKMDAMYDVLEKYGMPLEQWLKEKGIWE